MPSRSTAFCSAFSASCPLVRRAVVLAAGAAVPGRELGLVLIEAEGVQRVDGELQAVDDFVLDLLRRAEDVRVVLRESADAKQSVHHARALVAIDRAEFAQTHRQVAIAAQPVAVDQDVERAVHRLELVFGIVQLHRA